MDVPGDTPPTFLRPRPLLAIITVVFAFEATVRGLTPVGDQDSFWIAAAGRGIWATGHAPTLNAFSFTDPGHPWIFHEIAFGLLYAKGLAMIGPAFLDLFGVLAGALTFFLVLFQVLRTTKHPATAALVGLPLLVEIPLFHPRPPFAALGFIAAMIVLAFGPRFSLVDAVVAVLLEWLWTLSHGSFPLGVVLVLTAALEADAAESRQRRRLLLITTLLAALVTFANPYGAGLHGLVRRYLMGDNEAASVVQRHVIEFLPIWQAPFAFGRFDAPAVALVTAVSTWCLLRARTARALLVFGLSLFAVLEVRNVHIALLVGGMLLAPALDDALTTIRATLRPGVAALLIVAPGVVVGVATWLVLLMSRPSSAWLGRNVGGPDLLAILPAIPDGAHVYAPFGVSPAVVWYAGQRGVRVFYDARNDCYSPPIALASFTMEDPGSTPDETLTSFGVEYALVRRGREVAEALTRSARWNLVAETPGLVLYRRQSPALPM